MGKVPIRLREVTYTLSPFEQKILPGLWKGLGYEVRKKLSNNLLDWMVAAVPVVGTVW